MFGRLLLGALLAATLASAQRGGGGRNSGMGGDETVQQPRQRQTRFDLFADKLKLTKEQKDEALNSLAAAYEESAPVRLQLDKRRTDIAEALIDGKSGDEVKKLMDDYTATVAQMTGIEAKAFSKVYASLKPNQQGKAGQAFELMTAAIENPGGGRGGRGRGKQ